MALLDLADRNDRIASIMAECARLYGGGGALAEAKYRFWAQALQHLHPVPGQRYDTPLSDVIITKGSRMPSVALGIVDFETLASGGWLVTAAGRVEGALKTALQRLGGLALSEMHNKGLGKAGEVRSVKIEGGIARLVARVGPHAGTVVSKIRHRVLPFIEIIHDGAGQILDVSLVDRPEASDGIEKSGRTVLAKLYRRESDPVKKQKKIEKAAVQFTLNHQMTGADPNMDRTVFKALYSARQPLGQNPHAPVSSALGLLTARRG
jgi:hypothetical protein